MIGLNYMYLLISLEMYNIAIRLLSPIHQLSSCITLSFAEQFGFDLKRVTSIYNNVHKYSLGDDIIYIKSRLKERENVKLSNLLFLGLSL